MRKINLLMVTLFLLLCLIIPSLGSANADIVNTTGSARFQGIGDQGGVEYRVAQSFTTPSTNIAVSQIDLELSETLGAPSSNDITVRIETDDSGRPSGLLAQSGAMATTSVTTVSSVVYTVNSWIFSSSITLNASTKYWIVTSVPLQDDNDGWVFNRSAYGSYPEGGYNISNTGGQTWSNENPTTDLYFKVHAVISADTTPPVITLNGNASETVEYGTVYTDAGATATDDVGGDITANITITGLPVDTNTLGAKTITYNVSDAAGNAATQVIRTVNVVSSGGGGGGGN